MILEGFFNLNDSIIVEEIFLSVKVPIKPQTGALQITSWQWRWCREGCIWEEEPTLGQRGLVTTRRGTQAIHQQAGHAGLLPGCRINAGNRSLLSLPATSNCTMKSKSTAICFSSLKEPKLRANNRAAQTILRAKWPHACRLLTNISNSASSQTVYLCSYNDSFLSSWYF